MARPLESAYEELTVESTRGILPRGGTILGSSRTNPLKRPDGVETLRRNLEGVHLDGLIAIGGEDTLGAASALYEEGLPVLGVPKTIDNDLGGTDATFGFDTAVHVATEAIDRLHTTAESHNRILIVEVMGRHAGWIALHSGLAGGADVILIPERPFDIAEVCRLLERRHARGRYFSIVVVAEGAVPREGTMEVLAEGQTDEFGHVRLGGIGQRLEREIESRTGFEARTTVLGYVQRGGTPTAFDRVLATRLGPRGGRRRDRAAVGHDAGAARHPHRAGAAGGGGRRAAHRAARGLRGGGGVLRVGGAVEAPERLATARAPRGRTGRSCAPRTR
ncbi:MAG: ATP-dependent 6-phosphofructokinase [Thermoleophilaceae bacterium]